MKKLLILGLLCLVSAVRAQILTNNPDGSPLSVTDTNPPVADTNPPVADTNAAPVVTNTPQVSETNPPPADTNTAPVVANVPPVVVPVAPPAPPTITMVQTVDVHVAPIHLTATQMAGIIQAVQSVGVQANVQITPDNLDSIYLFSEGGGYTATIKLK